MILTTCAACAAPLAHNAPRCVRCWTRYCDSTCQHDHWRRGHKQICKRIHRGGNAEQYNADKKYKEAVAVAVEKCAADTKGQTCFICMEGVKRRTGEGLVSAFCACRGGSSFAHVSCLAEQVKVLVEEYEERNLGLNCSASRRDDLAEAVAILEDVSQRGRRVFGPDHPEHRGAPNMLECARNKLASVDKRLATCAKFGVHCPDCNYDDSDSLDDC